MRDRSKDNHIMLHILDYCNQIQEAVKEIETYEKLIPSNFNKNALAMPFVQIGELVRILSNEFKEQHSEIPWVEVKTLRNVLVHSYGKIEWDKLWDTAISDIPDFLISSIQYSSTFSLMTELSEQN